MHNQRALSNNDRVNVNDVTVSSTITASKPNSPTFKLNKIILNNDSNAKARKRPLVDGKIQLWMFATPDRCLDYDYNLKICENDEDFDELYLSEKEFRRGMLTKVDQLIDKQKIEYRENIVCKIKKITDSFKLQDETFYRSVFLYDYFDQLKGLVKENSEYKIKTELHDSFEFGKTEEEETRKWKYVKFFESLSAIAIIVKFVESDKNSPKVLDLLKFYWAEKLNLDINTKRNKIELIYDYVCEKQRQMLFNLDWKLQTVSIVHFLDHYKRILPEVQNMNIDIKPDSKLVH